KTKYALKMKLFFFQAEDGIRDRNVTGVQTCALPILNKTYSTIEVGYGEGKRQAEQVLFTKAPFEVTAYRFPIVLDLDDYTKRLRSEERRVGKESSRRWSRYHQESKEKEKTNDSRKHW